MNFAVSSRPLKHLLCSDIYAKVFSLSSLMFHGIGIGKKSIRSRMILNFIPVLLLEEVLNSKVHSDVYYHGREW